MINIHTVQVWKSNPYADKELIARMSIQSRMLKAAGYGRRDPSDAGYCPLLNLSPHEVREIAKLIHCDRCGKKIENLWTEVYRHNGFIVFHLCCHGMEEVFHLTFMDCSDAIKRCFAMRAFIDPAKEEVREWIRQMLAWTGPRLLENRERIPKSRRLHNKTT